MATGPVNQRLRLQHLKFVISVAEWGSMARAAKHLAVSQPVVSKVIADLENMLGVPLFDRSSRGVEPTSYGRALLKRSIALFDDLTTSVDEIKFMANPASGELRIGSTEPLLAGPGAAVMKRLWQRYPGVNFRIVEADSATLLNRDLPERHIELALVPLLSSFANKELDATILFKDRLCVVVGKKSPCAHRRGITLADLLDQPWCVAPSSVGTLLTDAIRASNLNMPRVAFTTTTSHLLLQLLESGEFVGHFGERLLQFFVDRFAVKILPIELPVEPFAVAIVRVKNRSISPLARLFIDCAREITEPLTKPRSVKRRGGKSARRPTNVAG